MRYLLVCFYGLIIIASASYADYLDISGVYTFEHGKVTCKKKGELTLPDDRLDVFRHLGRRDVIEIRSTENKFEIVSRNPNIHETQRAMELTVPVSSGWNYFEKNQRMKVVAESDLISVIKQDLDKRVGCWGPLCGALLGGSHKWLLSKKGTKLRIQSSNYSLNFWFIIPVFKFSDLDCLVSSVTTKD